MPGSGNPALVQARILPLYLEQELAPVTQGRLIVDGKGHKRGSFAIQEVGAMSARILGCMLVLLILLVASAVLAEGTWYGLREQYAVENTQATERSGQVERVEEIEVAPGVRVRAGIWDDDHVPTYEDLV